MSDTRTIALRGQEGQRDWDYGDFPYGLEPLVMPASNQLTGLAPQPPAVLTDYDVNRTWAALELPPLTTGLVRPENADTLYWFRWITGHQVTMLLWNLMGELVGEVSGQERAGPHTLTNLEFCTNGYTAMLKYSASCSPEIYQSLIRPRMYLQHRAFSGLWAVDYAPLRRFLRGHVSSWMSGPTGASLAAAVATNRATHEAVAERLVPAGKSLLQQSVAHTAVRPTARTAAIFDTFFMTIRAQIGRDAVVAQLLHRIRAVAFDLAANGAEGLSPSDDIVASLRHVVGYVTDHLPITR